MGTLSAAVKNKMLDAVAGRTTYTAEAAFYLKLHLGSPGSDGSANAAAETTRQAVTFGDAAASGAIANTAAVQWVSVSNTEAITHVSFWSASTAGTFLGADDLPATKSVTAGDTLTIAIGDVDLDIAGTLP